jgi:hypothetical protein
MAGVGAIKEGKGSRYFTLLPATPLRGSQFCGAMYDEHLGGAPGRVCVAPGTAAQLYVINNNSFI